MLNFSLDLVFHFSWYSRKVYQHILYLNFGSTLWMRTVADKQRKGGVGAYILWMLGCRIYIRDLVCVSMIFVSTYYVQLAQITHSHFLYFGFEHFHWFRFSLGHADLSSGFRTSFFQSCLKILYEHLQKWKIPGIHVFYCISVKHRVHKSDKILTFLNIATFYTE